MKSRASDVLRSLTVVWAVIVFLGAAFRAVAACASFGLPFTDLGTTTFCAQIAEAYYSGLTNGTSATTYSPSQNVPREQMAAFVTRTLDQSLLRGNRRAALDQWWSQTPHFDRASLGLTTVGAAPQLLKSDGLDLWVPNNGSDSVSRVRASDGAVLGTWTGATQAEGVLVAMGKVFVTGQVNPGKLYMIDPASAPTAVTTVATTVGEGPEAIAFDGNNIWTANSSGSSNGTLSIIAPGTWTVTPVTAGLQGPAGLVFDGSNIWVTDWVAGTLLKLDSAGTILKTVTVGQHPLFPAFDGHNIWVPNSGNNTLTVVRVSDGTVLKTFSSANGNQNGLNVPIQAAFDGQRIMVTNANGGLSLFRATDLSIIGNPGTPGTTNPYGVCSDGINFWVSFDANPGKIGRF